MNIIKRLEYLSWLRWDCLAWEGSEQVDKYLMEGSKEVYAKLFSLVPLENIRGKRHKTNSIWNKNKKRKKDLGFTVRVFKHGNRLLERLWHFQSWRQWKFRWTKFWVTRSSWPILSSEIQQEVISYANNFVILSFLFSYHNSMDRYIFKRDRTRYICNAL